MRQLLDVGHSLLLSILLFVVMPATFLHVLDHLSMGTGSGGAFDFPTQPAQLGLCFGFLMLAFPFLVATIALGLPLASTMQWLGLPVFSDVVLPVHHGTLTIDGVTAAAMLVGLIAQVFVWTVVLQYLKRRWSVAIR